MSDADQLLAALLPERELVLVALEVAERGSSEIVAEMEADYDAQPYAGMDDRDYPLWQKHSLGDEWTFVLSVDLEDYGYALDEEIDDMELPKSSGEGDVGAVRYELEFLDRFSGNLMFRGHLKGASYELNMDVKLKLSIFGHRRPGRFGFAGETIAEGYAFEQERRYKQAFFCYFSALESHLDVLRQAFNESTVEGRLIPENDRLLDKLSKLTAAALYKSATSLNKVSFWGYIKSRFAELEALRNAVAHNRRHKPVSKRDAAEAFAVIAILLPMLEGVTPDVASILGYYGAAHRGNKKIRWDEDDD